MLLKTCSKCGTLIPYGMTRCPECESHRAEEDKVREQRNAKRYRRKVKTKDPKYKSFYKSKAWRTLSRYMMTKADYRCQECGGIATEVHHIKPIQTEAGWDRRLDEDNLKVLCIRCHNAEHQRWKSR